MAALCVFGSLVAGRDRTTDTKHKVLSQSTLHQALLASA
jgi:hypothetical protein